MMNRDATLLKWTKGIIVPETEGKPIGHMILDHIQSHYPNIKVSSMSVINDTVAGLFAGYAALWAIKRRQLIGSTGLDPEVLARATSPVQAYFARLVSVFTILVVGLIVLHGFIRIPMGLTARMALVEHAAFDIAGGVLGVVGLSVCWVAQRTMGESWRVGIDKENRTSLVTSGIFCLIRNPTYLGLHVVNLGMWLIWPTAAVGFYAVLFFVVMEIQVRAEEEHLTKLHGDRYRTYKKKSWRYLPWVY